MSSAIDDKISFTMVYEKLFKYLCNLQIRSEYQTLLFWFNLHIFEEK